MAPARSRAASCHHLGAARTDIHSVRESSAIHPPLASRGRTDCVRLWRSCSPDSSERPRPGTVSTALRKLLR